jgi:hypothetical protein
MCVYVQMSTSPPLYRPAASAAAHQVQHHVIPSLHHEEMRPMVNVRDCLSPEFPEMRRSPRGHLAESAR